MNNTLAVVIVMLVATAAVYTVALIMRHWDNISKGWIADDPDGGMSDVHPDLHDRAPRIPPFAPSMGGSPVESQLLTYGMYSAPRQRLVQAYCPECETEKWRTGRRVPHLYPAGIPRLCDRHAPTALVPAIRKENHA